MFTRLIAGVRRHAMVLSCVLACSFALATPSLLHALQQTDSMPADTVVSTPDPHTQFVLGLGVLAAYIARELGSLLVGLWNKAGNFLDGKSNGFKQAVAVALSGALGLLINAVANALTHQTNWIVTFALSVAMGMVSVVNAGVTIDAVKSKMTSMERQSVAGR